MLFWGYLKHLCLIVFFILLEKCVFCILPARQKTVIIIKNLQKNLFLVLHHVCMCVCVC